MKKAGNPEVSAGELGVFQNKLWLTSWIGVVGWRTSVLDCGSLLPLLRHQFCG